MNREITTKTLRVFVISLGNIYESDKDKKRQQYIRRDYLLQECGVIVPSKSDEDILDGYHGDDLVVTGDQLLSMFARKIQLSIKHEANIEHEPVAFLDSVQKALDKINKIETQWVHKQSEFNDKVNVHMPGNLLMTFNESMLLNDSCTDVLQDSLNQGWRVIAACPQPDQRRPDYILGRYNPALETRGNSAKRKEDL